MFLHGFDADTGFARMCPFWCTIMSDSTETDNLIDYGKLPSAMSLVRYWPHPHGLPHSMFSKIGRSTLDSL